MYKPLRHYACLLLIIAMVAVAGCSEPAQSDQGQPNSDNTKAKNTIANTLQANKDIFKVTWSPDGTAVVYIQTGKPDKNGLDEAYIWRVGEAKAKFIRDVSPTTHGFNWSPDSKYFLISEKRGEGAISTIVDAHSLQAAAYKINSVGSPVWSKDSKALVYGNEQHEYGESWGSLEVYKLGQTQSEYIWYAPNYLYKAESWDAAGNISYTEINPQGKSSHKTTRNIRPSISGVHLGDTKEQVRRVLGNGYQETLSDDETVYSEQVYHWNYDKGYLIIIGKDSGKVLEIVATSSEAETNLGAKIGDTAEKVFNIYRPKYIEPVSIHGDQLIGTFKVEGAAALVFVWDIKEGMTLQDIKPEDKVIRMVLSYPQLLDDSF